MDQVNLIDVVRPLTPTLGITTSPHGSSFNYPGLITVYTAPTTYYTPIAQTIQFSGSATFYDSNVDAIEWDWDFGDGDTAQGQTVNHIYELVSPAVQAVLRVTDNRGFIWATRQAMYLKAVPVFRISPELPTLSATSHVFSTNSAIYLKPRETPVIVVPMIPAI